MRCWRGLGSLVTGSPLNGVLAVGSLQSNQGSALTATIFGPEGVAIAADAANNATLTLNANTVSASATGNSVINAINLNASTSRRIASFQADTLSPRGIPAAPLPTISRPSGDVTLNNCADQRRQQSGRRAQSNGAVVPNLWHSREAA